MQWPGSDNIEVKASEKIHGYIGEVTICLSSLNKLGLLKNNILEAGLYRGYCMKHPNSESELKWILLMKSNLKTLHFHIPSSLGILKLESECNP